MNENKHAEEGVVMLLSEKMLKCVKESEGVNSIIMRLELNTEQRGLDNFEKCTPGSVRSEEERKHFRQELNDEEGRAK